MYLKRLVSACAAIFPLCFSSFAQSSGSDLFVEQLVAKALAANQEYLAVREQLNEAAALVRQAGLRPAPAIEIETATGALTGSSGESEYSAAYFHTIETAGKRSKRLAVSEIGLALVDAELREQERQLAFEVKSRFILAVAEQLKLASARSLTTVNEQNYQLTLQRVELGDAAPLEGQLLGAEVNRTAVQISLLEAAEEAAVMELRTAIGLSPEDPLEVIAELPIRVDGLTLDGLKTQALEARPDLARLRLLEEQAAASADLAVAEGRPDITAFARYTRSRSRFDQSGFSDTGVIVPLQDTDNILSFGVSIPLFGPSRTKAAETAARSRQDQRRLQREHLERVIPQEVEAAYRRWSGARNALRTFDTGVIDPIRKSLEVIREAYQLGQLRLFDVLNEQRRFLELQFDFVNAQAEAAHALVELELAVGGELR